MLQIIASVVLGMARIDEFAEAAAEPARLYLLVAALLTVGVFSVWLARERVAVALGLVVAWPLGLWLGLRGKISMLGLAFHGEFFLHHFSALTCLVLAISVPASWARDPRLGKLRALPLMFAVPGATLLAAAHLAPLDFGPEWTSERWVATAGAGLLLLTWPLATALFWTEMAPKLRRPIALILLLPVVLRLAFAGVDGLSGALILPARVPWLGAGIVVAALATLLLLRPRLDRLLTGVIGLICLVGSMFFYYFYEHGFGEFEDGLGGLLQSMFGFQVPYPPYADDLRSAALMMGLFFMSVTVYSALVSSEDRVRGTSLGLMVVAGLGLSSPHLALMLGVGAMLFVETLLPGAPFRDLAPPWFEAGRSGVGTAGAPPPARTSTSPDDDQLLVRASFEALAARLDIEAPTEVETDVGYTVAIRDELDGASFDLRARLELSGARLELIVGLRGRGDTTFELVPEAGDRGQRPAHLLARSHRVVGELRALEAFGDAPLDALTSFPTAYLRAWEGGIQIELGRDLSKLDVDTLEALLRALVRAR